jgi:lipopolysaccharide biosynthesis glycosyltransferase
MHCCYRVPETCAHSRAIPAEPGSDALSTPVQPTPDSFLAWHTINSGIVVLTPGEEIYNKLIHALHTDPEVTKYDFPDQDFIASQFKNRIKFLGYEYNATKHMRDCHKALWRDEGVRNCHFIFKEKPWVIPESGGTNEFNHQFRVVHGWWRDEWRRLEAEMKDAEWWGLVKALVVDAA